MKSIELRELAKLWLRNKHPDALILHELSVAEFGGAMVDVAAITPTQIIGVEVKGDGDGPSRLMRQGYMYSRVCRTMHILCDPAVWEKCAKHVPEGWGVIEMAPDETKFGNYDVCPLSNLATYKYRTADETGYGLAPVALAAMPWTKEYREFELALKTNLPEHKAKCVASVAERFPLRKIEAAVCHVLRKRNWYAKDVLLPSAASEKP